MSSFEQFVYMLATWGFMINDWGQSFLVWCIGMYRFGAVIGRLVYTWRFQVPKRVLS